MIKKQQYWYSTDEMMSLCLGFLDSYMTLCNKENIKAYYTQIVFVTNAKDTSKKNCFVLYSEDGYFNTEPSDSCTVKWDSNVFNSTLYTPTVISAIPSVYAVKTYNRKPIIKIKDSIEYFKNIAKNSDLNTKNGIYKKLFSEMEVKMMERKIYGK